MPGKRITDHQVHKYKQYRNRLTQVAAAAKAAISERSARRIEASDGLPSQREARHWRTRDDPLAAVWDGEVVPLLQSDAQLNAVTLLEELQRRHPGEYGGSVLRTLQRRLRQWRAVHGAERDVYFAQEHPPGWLGLSDFTVADDLGIEIDGIAFAHRLYQFALAHSGWRHAVVLTEGESFLALSSGLQDALWRLGGVPEEHRTDSLSAAFNNLAEQQELTRRYEELCRHYGMRASRCNPGQSHENGSIEARHGSLKSALDQALRLRGSRRFDGRAAYEALRRRRRAALQRARRQAAGYRTTAAQAVATSAHRGIRGAIGARQQVRDLHRQGRAVQRAEPADRPPADACGCTRSASSVGSAASACSSGRGPSIATASAIRATSTTDIWWRRSGANPAPSHAGCSVMRCSRDRCTGRPGSGSSPHGPSVRHARPSSGCSRWLPTATKRSWPTSWSS